MSTAQKTLMNYLARRAYSESELRQKLSPRFSAPDVDTAIALAHERGWLEKPEDLAAKLAEQWGRKGKGNVFIQAYLRKKGLPPTPKNPPVEIHNAQAVVNKHLHLKPPYAAEHRPAIFRLLQNRGFSGDVARAVAHLTES